MEGVGQSGSTKASQAFERELQHFKQKQESFMKTNCLSLAEFKQYCKKLQA